MHQDQTALFTRELLPPEDWSWLAPDRPAFYCTGRPIHLYGPNGEHEVYEPCGRLLPDFCFRSRGSTYACSRGRPVMPRCVACEQKIRTARNRLWFWKRRTQKALQSHMIRERRQGLHCERNLADFLKLGGLTIDEIAEAMQHAAEHDTECSHCGRHWSEMPGGAKMQITLDRTDPQRLMAHDNWGLKCRTGNPQKGTTSPRVQQIRDAYWRHLRERGLD